MRRRINPIIVMQMILLVIMVVAKRSAEEIGTLIATISVVLLFLYMKNDLKRKEEDTKMMIRISNDRRNQ